MVQFRKKLTLRQRQLLRHVARGGTTKQFAKLHNISFRTADEHRYRLMKAIECHNAAECTMYAIKFGYIELGGQPGSLNIPHVDD
jgi:DNA-binding NarL/FixJ family response regulator